jgi:hypothetical protein
VLDLNVFLTLVAALALLLVPGLGLALSLRIRGWAAVGSAPILTFALVLTGIVVLTAVGVGWTPLAFAAVSVLVIGLALAAGALRRRRKATDEVPLPDRDDDGSGRLWSLLAVAGALVGAAIGFSTIVVGTDDLTSPNQGFDALFHVNLIEIITRTGEVFPTVAGAVNGYPEGATVYPDAFHAMASLIDQLHGGSLTSINALMACIPVVAGLGLVGLLRDMGLVRAAAVVPITLASTSGYPTDLVWRGPIWVYVFGISLVPAFLLLLRLVLGRREIVPTVALGLAAAGLALVHPSAALSAAVFAAWLLVGRWLARRSVPVGDLTVLVPAAVVAAVLAVPLIGQAVADTSGGSVIDWPTVQSAGQAVGELLLYNYENDYPQLWLAIPALIGLVVGWRHPSLRWWYGATGSVVALCVLAAAYEGWVVQLLTSPWWNDRYRFEGLVFLALSVFAAVGVVVLGDLVGGLLRAVAARAGGRAPVVRAVAAPVGVCLVLALIGYLSSGFYVDENRYRMEIAYVPGGGGSVADADLPAFQALHDLAGQGPVLNDPNDGSAWMWALAGVRPVFGAALTFPVKPPLPPERQLVVDALNCLDSDARVREAVQGLGVRYVYSSSTTIIGPPTPNLGFRDLSSVQSLTPVYERDGVTIYEIDLVPLEDAPGDACELS